MTNYTVIDSPEDLLRFHWRWYEWAALVAICVACVAVMVWL